MIEFPCLLFWPELHQYEIVSPKHVPGIDDHLLMNVPGHPRAVDRIRPNYECMRDGSAFQEIRQFCRVIECHRLRDVERVCGWNVQVVHEGDYGLAITQRLTYYRLRLLGLNDRHDRQQDVFPEPHFGRSFQ